MVRIYFILVVLSLSISFSKAQTVDSTHNMVTFIEDVPFFKGDIKVFIQDNIKYPNNAQIDSIQGKVFISFWVDTNGVTFDHRVIKGIRKDLDKEALRVSKLIRFEKPAMQKGKPIKVSYVIPIEFKLNDKNKSSQYE